MHVFGAAVGPEVGAADAGGGDADDGVGGLDEGGTFDVFDSDVAGGVQHDSAHEVLLGWGALYCRGAPPGRALGCPRAPLRAEALLGPH